MKIRSITIALVLLVSGCGGKADIDGIKNSFIKNRVSFERLYSMIQEDTKVLPCFAVGTDHIGEYWSHDGKWNKNQNYDRKIPLDDILKEIGLSIQRYQDYLKLFKETGSERIEYCPKAPSWARIIVYRSGLAVSGCLTSININGDESVPATKIQPSDSSEITPLGDGWYINHDCT